MGEFLIVTTVAFLIFGVLLAVLHRRAQSDSETPSGLGGCGRAACRCQRQQRPSDDSPCG
ncbi:MAG: hypothetical protein R6X05_14820 [Desulfobacterales bacterium]|jgi:membrane protein implicated in regulation of membrane protease activity